MKNPIVISITIFVLISFLVLPNLMPSSHIFMKGNEARDKLTEIGFAIILFESNSGNLLTNAEGLEKLINTNPQILPRLPIDPWGEEYKYIKLSSDSFIILSTGSVSDYEKAIVQVYFKTNGRFQQKKLFE